MRFLVGLFAFLLATPSWAQPASPSVAEALIARNSAQGVFEALPSEAQIVVRHTRSGLTCHMDASWSNRLMIFPQAARGEDVSCESTNGRQTIRLYATRYTFRTTLNDQFNGAVAAIQQRFPDARPYQPTLTSATSGASQSRSGYFLASRPSDHAQVYTRISVTIIRDWVIVMRYSTLSPDADAAARGERASNTLWSQVLTEAASGHL